jgi:hypothetical protein
VSAAGPPAQRHQPAPLSAGYTETIGDLARAAIRQGVVVYAAAGLSMSAPTSGPRGDHVADDVRGWLARKLGIEEADLAAKNLEQLGQLALADSERTLAELKERVLQAFPFAACDPNYGHEALALMMREGLAAVISVNWDCAVERAGRAIDINVESVVAAGQRLTLAPDDVPIYKVHGCARRPLEHLALTQDEVDAPQDWAQAEVQNAIHGERVIFVGLGTIGLYVREPVATQPELWVTGTPTNITIVEPGDLPAAWTTTLGEAANDVHLRMGADEFFDELLRAIVCRVLDEIEAAVQSIQNLEWPIPMLNGLLALRTALAPIHADAVLRWWRDGVSPTDAGKSFLLELAGRQALMTVALLLGHDNTPIEATGTRDRLAVGSQQRYLEIASLPGQQASRVREIHTDRVIRRRETGVYPDLRRPVTVVSAGHFGEFPSDEAPIDIAAPEPGEFEMGEPDLRANIRFESAAAGVENRIRLAA